MSVQQPGDNKLAVQFRYIAQLNQAKSLNEGRPIYDDVEVCEIRAPGSKDVRHFPSVAFSHWDYNDETGEQNKVSYAERFARQFQQFKARAAQTVSGTPLDFATFLTDGKRAELRAQNVYTIEALAALEGLELKNIGIGGRELKNRAIAFIDAGRSTAGDLQLKVQLEQLKARNEILEEDARVLQARALVQAQAAAMGKLDVPVHVTPSAIPSAAELFGLDEVDDFATMSDEALAEYIAEYTGRAPIGTLPRKTLLRMAAEATPKAA